MNDRRQSRSLPLILFCPNREPTPFSYSIRMFHSPDYNGPLMAPTILIVEDEPMLAFLLEEVLVDAGFESAGIAGRLETVLSRLDGGPFADALLDSNLAGVSTGPAATALAVRGLPFVVVSGYSIDQQPKEFSGAPSLQKPCRASQLIQALCGILPAFEIAR